MFVDSNVITSILFVAETMGDISSGYHDNIEGGVGWVGQRDGELKIFKGVCERRLKWKKEKGE